MYDITGAMKPRIAVIGAGVSGLSTAYNVQQCLPEAQITIIADQFSPNTTSDVAAGFWFPYLLKDTPKHLQSRWSKLTLDHLKKLFNSPEASTAGVSTISGYWLLTKEAQQTDVPDVLESIRKLKKHELEMWPEYKTGYFFNSYTCEGYIYLPWLLNKFRQGNGRVVKRKLDSIEELLDSYDIVVNCSGVGAAKLTGDTSLEPVRGQAFRVKAPWLKHFYIFDPSGVTALPGINNVVVGGTTEYGMWDAKPNPEESGRIWTEICRYIPSLKNATIEKEICGLRPSRTQVRLETEMVCHKNRVIPVIHNYGHGGGGVTLHWGCAIDAADMVKQAAGRIGLPESRL